MEQLKDKTYRTYEYTSRYTKFPVYYNTEDDKYVYGLTGQLLNDIDDSVQEYEVQPGDTLDSIAFKFYGRPDLFWVVADFNRIKDSLITLYGNYKILNIPGITTIEFKKK